MEAAVAQIRPEVAELRPGQRFEGRFACIAKERQTARNGSTYLSLRLRDRSGTIAARAFRDADRIGLRFEAGDAVAVRGTRRALPRRARGRARRRAPARAGQLRPGRVPADRLPLDRRARGLPRAPGRRGPRPGAARGGRPGRLQRPARGGLPARALHPALASRLPRRAARAHGRGRHPGARDLRAAPAARLRPADGGGDRPRRRPRARVHATAPSSSSARRAGCSATWRSAPRSSAPRPPSSPRSAGWSCSTACSPTTAPTPAPVAPRAPAAAPRQGSGFASPEALALYRLNSLDASVKGALEHG